MDEIEALVETFKREEYWWSKELVLPFWGGQLLEVLIYIDDDEENPHPSPEQMCILQQMLRREVDFRPYFAATLFDHYQKNIYGYATYYSEGRGYYGADEITPPINTPSQLWPLINEPNVWIPNLYDEYDGSVQFELGFEVHWDDEHGLEVTVVDWEITDFE